MTPESIAGLLGRTGLCVVPNFLSPESLRDTRNNLDAIQKSGGLHRATTGQGDRAIHDFVRRDEIHWLDKDTAVPIQSALFVRLAELQQAFNRELYLGLNDFEGHYAIYPQGGFYRRHRDSFKNDDARVVSIIVYLNHDWQLADGGELRVYQKDNTYTSVSPVGGTMVCFMSQDSEHEVMQSYRPRSSFAGWFKRARSLHVSNPEVQS